MMVEPILEIAKSLKFDLTLIKISKAEQMQHFTSNISYDRFYTRSFDTVASLLTNNNENTYHIDATESFFYDFYYWVVPTPETSSKLMILLIAFGRYNFAILVVITILMGLVVWAYSKHIYPDRTFVNFPRSVILAYGITLSTYSNIWPKVKILRYLLLMQLFFSVLIQTVYQAKLIDYLTVPRYKKGLLTLEDLVESDIKIMCHHYIYSSLMEIKGDELADKVWNRIVLTDMDAYERLRQVAVYQNVSSTIMWTVITSSPFAHNVRHVGGKLLVPIRAFYPMRKSHPFFEKINFYVKMLFASGFPYIWLQNNKMVHFKKAENTTVVLSLSHMKGCFLLWTIGSGIAVFIFIVEMRNVFKFFARRVIRKISLLIFYRK